MAIMESRAAILMLRYKSADGTWKRAEVARGANGRAKPGHVKIGNELVKVEGGIYQVRYYQDRQAKYASVGRDANAAETQRRRLEQQTTVKADAKQAGIAVIEPEACKTIATAAKAYISDAEARGATEAAEQARLVTAEFQRIVRKTFIDEVSREDILRFLTALGKRGCSDRTISNKFARMKSWLLFSGLKKDVMPPKPKYEVKLPTVYTSDQISSILGAAGDYMALAIRLALNCGLREQELIHLEWSDLFTDEKLIRIQGKPQYDFKVKDSEQREVPVPDALLSDLLKWKADRKGITLILANENGKPNSHLLRALKRLAKNAGLNCGHCAGCKDTVRECRQWNLHKFRRTYCTTLLRNGVDLRTVQALAGHADLDSTLRYLRPAAAKEINARINAISW